MKVEDTAPSVDREQLRARLKEIAPPLAEVYGGAIAALSQPGLPARAHFLAHAAREIANGLPEWTSGVAGSPREADRLAQLADKWVRTFPEGPIKGEATGEPPAGVVIPREIFGEMSRILADRSTRSSSRDSIIRFFNWLGPGNRYLPADLTRFVREWMALRKWFEANAHARRSPRQAPPDDAEAVAYFERFERWLDSLLKGFFANQRELDAKLEETPPERLAELVPLLVPDQQRRHFFNRLAEKQDPKWLGARRAAGFLENPPAQVLRDPDSTPKPTLCGLRRRTWYEWPRSRPPKVRLPQSSRRSLTGTTSRITYFNAPSSMLPWRCQRRSLQGCPVACVAGGTSSPTSWPSGSAPWQSTWLAPARQTML
jgi:hypothetical protein